MTITPETLAQMRANAVDRLGRPAMPDPREAQRTIWLCDAVAEAWDEGYGAGASDEEHDCGPMHAGRGVRAAETTNPYRQETDR